MSKSGSLFEYLDQVYILFVLSLLHVHQRIAISKTRNPVCLNLDLYLNIRIKRILSEHSVHNKLCYHDWYMVCTTRKFFQGRT